MLATSLVGLLLVVYGAGVARVWRSAGYGHAASGRARRWPSRAAGSRWPSRCRRRSTSGATAGWSAHMVQHELLMVVAAPLVAVSAPLIALLWAMPAGVRRRAPRRSCAAPITAAVDRPDRARRRCSLLHALALWIWHLPALYDYALEHEAHARRAAPVLLRHRGAVLVGHRARPVRPRAATARRSSTSSRPPSTAACSARC